MPPTGEQIHDQTNMDQLLEQCAAAAAARTGRGELRIIIVHESIVAAARALRACDILRHTTGDGPLLRIDVWNANDLADGMNRTLAAASAAAADIVILSLAGRDSLPAGVSRWLDGWLLPDPRPRGILLALCGDGPSQGAMASLALLRHRASASATPFLSHPVPESMAPNPVPALPVAAVCDPDEWRPGHVDGDPTFDLVEEFGARLRARLRDIRFSTHET